jgi:hypothetical protein
VLSELTPRARRVLYHLPAWGAFLFLLAMYSRYALDFPYYDQWELVPFLEKDVSGTLRFGDFWAQHNEHRLVFPRLLMVVMARLSHWNIYWEFAASLVFAAMTWIAVAVLIRRSSARVHEGENGPLYMIAALVLFSLSQWQNWFLGWQLQEFMNVLAIVLAIPCLTWQRYTTPGVFLAMFWAVVATYSFANGILVWPIGFVLLFLQRKEREGAFLREIAGWTMMGTMVVTSYLYGYETPPYHAPLSEALFQPLHVLLYLLAYIGQPLGNIDVMLAICMGGLGILVWIVTLCQLWVSRVPLASLLPWIGLALYGMGTAALTALGRVDEGLEQALSSRYATMANLFWLPVVVQLYWVAQVSEGQLVKRLLPAKLTCICGALLIASLVGAYRWTERYNAYDALRTEVRFGNDLERLRTLYPPAPEVILERRVFLREHELSIFRAPETK